FSQEPVLSAVPTLLSEIHRLPEYSGQARCRCQHLLLQDQTVVLLCGPEVLSLVKRCEEETQSPDGLGARHGGFVQWRICPHLGSSQAEGMLQTSPIWPLNKDSFLHEAWRTRD